MSLPLDKNWMSALSEFIDCKTVEDIWNTSCQLRKHAVIFPPENQVFRAFELTPYSSVRAVILGQDPYFGPNEAHGLAFSVPNGVKMPPTLRNIFKEYACDLGRSLPDNTDLTNWAENGVLLLNTILTVEQGKPESHKLIGWNLFSDAVIKAVNKKSQPVSFILWGKYAQSKAALISAHHNIIASPHPSPLSAYRGFFGSRPFSKAQINGWVWPSV